SRCPIIPYTTLFRSAALLGKRDPAGAGERGDGDRLRARQLAAGAGQAPVEHFGCGHHRARDSHRGADRLRVRRPDAPRRAPLPEGSLRWGERPRRELRSSWAASPTGRPCGSPPTRSTSWAWLTTHASFRPTARRTG